MLQYNGRRVMGFGVGAPDSIGSGIAALQAALAQVAGADNPREAVSSLRNAGNAAVGSVGPAIDALSGSDPAVMQATHAAWVGNGRLATVGDSNVSAAQSLVSDVIRQYTEAAKLAASKRPSPGPAPARLAPAASPSAPAADSTPGILDWFADHQTEVWLGAGAVVVVIGGALALAARRRLPA